VIFMMATSVQATSLCDSTTGVCPESVEADATVLIQAGTYVSGEKGKDAPSVLQAKAKVHQNPATAASMDGNLPAAGGTAEESTGDDSDGTEININFGGACDLSGSIVDNKYVPEFVKSKTCSMKADEPSEVDETTCKECLKGADCWQGLCAQIQGGAESPALEITTSAGDSSSHIAEFWADCTTDKAEWIVQTLTGDDQQFNAVVKVYVEGKPVEADEDVAGIYGGVGDTASLRFTISAEGGAKTRVWVVMTPIDAAQEAKATVKIVAWDAEAEAEKCMGKKMCLRNLNADGSAAGTALRNSNVLQFECLKNGKLYEGQSECAALNTKCKAWIKCLDTNSVAKSRLKSILQVSLNDQGIPEDSTCSSTGLLLLEKQNSGSGTSTLAENTGANCVHPTTDDPESWECDCANALDKVCAGRDPVCYKVQMCNSDKLCHSWKQEVGCHSSLVEESMESRQNKSSEQVTSLDDSVSLDESLSGKRSC